jgi:hypothetical protein
MPNPLPNIIHQAHLLRITNIAPRHPVFEVAWNDLPGKQPDRLFIVKGDEGSADSVGTAYMMMRDVARGARARLLDPQERKFFFAAGAQDSVADPATKAYLTTLMAAPFQWVLMGYKAALLELDKVLSAQDAGTAALMLACLKDAENLQRLGAILAVDMFTNNTDRFEVLPGRKGIANKGNVFFVRKASGDLRIKGLDPFDYTKSKARLETVVTGTKDHTDAGWWSGILLKSDAELERIAKNACKSLSTELGGILRASGYAESVIKQLSLRSEHVKTVVASMKTTRQLIKDSCTAKMMRTDLKAQVRTGLQSRMQALGWVK